MVIAQLRHIGLLPVRPYGCRRGMLALSKRCGCEPVYNNNMSNVSMRVRCLPWVMLAAHASHCVLTKAEALCCATVLCCGTGRGREAFLLLGVWWSVGGGSALVILHAEGTSACMAGVCQSEVVLPVLTFSHHTGTQARHAVLVLLSVCDLDAVMLLCADGCCTVCSPCIRLMQQRFCRSV